MTSLRDQLQALLELVAHTEPDEIDCDDVLQRVGALFEVIERGQDPPPDMAAVAQHLRVCPECREEFNALMRAHEG